MQKLKNSRFVTRFLALFALATVMGTTLLAGVAGATPPADPTAGLGSSIQTGVTDWVQNYGIVMLSALVVLGIIIAVALRFARKAKNAI